MKLVECVPNFSEGRRPEIVEQIRSAIAAVEGAIVLDVSSDVSHNRSVITFVAPLERVADAAFAAIATARDLIDLTVHQGEHPRIGATDVVPFVPLEGTTMDECVALARALGARVGEELEIPVYLYERAATRPDRENLADVRRGEFELLRAEITTNDARRPDFGPARVHPTAGATAIGARPFLVAYNVYLGPASNLGIAKDVAKALRHSSGGLRFVKALGLEVDGQAQVSMNLVDIDRTPLHRAFDMVKMEAAAHGVLPTWSEVVGLVPERVLYEAAARHVQLRGLSSDMVIERRVRDALHGGESVSSFIASVAAPTPAPGGGSVAAHVGALGAALAQMVAGLTVGRKKYAAVEDTMQDLAREAAALGGELAELVVLDADAFTAVAHAYRLPREPEDALRTRAEAITEALLGAARTPILTARASARVCELAAIVATSGNANAISDAGVSALLGEAACRAAAYNVRINIAALEDRSRGESLMREAESLVARASRAAAEATAALERALL